MTFLPCGDLAIKSFKVKNFLTKPINIVSTFFILLCRIIKGEKNMTLKFGKMTTQELSEWFGMSYGSFRNAKKKKLEELLPR